MKRPDEEWRTPELERFGKRLREAELSERVARSRFRSRLTGAPVRRVVLGTLGALAAAAAVLEIVAPAGARSPVNEAPVAAERAKSVRFSSHQRITVDGRRVTDVRESGELDFMTGSFASRLIVGGTDEPIERRRIGGTLYLRQVRHHGDPSRRVRWSAITVRQSTAASFAPPGGYTLTDPQVVFRVLAEARSPTHVIGREQIDGVHSIHYRLSTSLDAFLRAEDGRPPTGPRGTGRAATLDVWLDLRGRPVRVEATFRGTARAHRAIMTTVVDFSAYGAPIVVNAPPARAIGHVSAETPHVTLGDPVRAAERLLGLVQ